MQLHKKMKISDAVNWLFVLVVVFTYSKVEDSLYLPVGNTPIVFHSLHTSVIADSYSLV